MSSEDYLIRIATSFAEDIRQHIARSIMRELQQNHRLSSDEPSLANTWNEICVMVQSPPFGPRALHQQLIDEIVARHVSNLRRHEMEALWLTTPEAEEWLFEQEEEREPFAPIECEVESHVLRAVLDLAGNWSNPDIRDYLG